MMNYEEFKETVVSEIAGFIGGRLSDAEVSVKQVAKNNVMHDGLVFSGTDALAMPMLYIDEIYKGHANDADAYPGMAEIRDLVEKNLDKVDPDVLSKIEDWDYARDRVFMRLVSSTNSEYVKDKVSRNVADLTILYSVQVEGLSMEEAPDVVSSVAVTDKLLDAYGVTEDALHKAALRNTNRDARIMSMTEMLGGMGCEVPEGNIPMYVITNVTRVNGASSLMSPDAMDEVAERLGTKNIYILPSSVHEAIAVPAEGSDVLELLAMVKEVNGAMVNDVDRLSDNVYTYDFEANELREADMYEEDGYTVAV